MLLFFFLIGLHAGWGLSYCKGTHYFFIYKLFVGFLHVFISIFNKIKTLRLFRLSVFLLLLQSRKSIRLLWKKC